MRSAGISDRVVQRGDVDRDDLAEIGQTLVEMDGVAQHREIGAIELQDEPGFDDRLIFPLHHVGKRMHVRLFARVVPVLEIARDLAGRRRGHEQFDGVRAAHRALGQVDVGLRGGPIPPAHRAGAGRSVLERRGELPEQLREFREFRIAGAERRRALAFKSREPVEHVHGIVGAALFAVVDDVDAAFDLLLHHMRDRLADRSGKLGLARAAIVLLGEQELDHLLRSRQAAGVGRENPLGAAFHERRPTNKARARPSPATVARSPLR